MVDDANDQFNFLQEVVNGNIQTAFFRLEFFDRNLHVMVNTSQDAGRVQIDEAQNATYQRLDDIKQDAANRSLDISVCLNGTVEQIDALPALITQLLQECVVDNLNDGLFIIDQAVTAVNGTRDRLTLIERQLQLCGPSATCLAVVISEISEEAQNIPKFIQDELEETSLLVGNSQVIIQTCSTTSSLLLQARASQILRQIRRCVNDLS